MEINNIAVLIDFENIAAGIEKEGLGKVEIGLIMNRLRERGRVLIARSYADWGRFSRHKKELMFEGVTLFELSAHGMQDKNRADVALVVDCMELAFTKSYVDTFVVVSGDSDFTPLIMKLRELDKKVIGCGTRRSTSRLIVEACDEFIFYDTLRKQTTQRPRRSKDLEGNELSREEAMELVTEALAALQRDIPGPVAASSIKEAILRKESAFSETDLGFSSLARFMEFCARQGIVRLEKDNRSGGYLVDNPDSEPAGPAPVVAPTATEGDSRRFYDMLGAEELEPLNRELRAELCRGVVEAVKERIERKRRNNLQWVCQDLARRFKGQVSQRQIKGLVNALHRGGVFVHSDGEPVRSFFAPFSLQHSPDELLIVLDQVYVGRLRELGVELSAATADIAALLYGDRRRVRDVEELLAWLSLSQARARARAKAAEEAAARESAVTERPEALEQRSEDPELELAPEPESDEAAAERRRRRRRGRGERGDRSLESRPDRNPEPAQSEDEEVHVGLLAEEPAAANEEAPPEPEEAPAPAKRAPSRRRGGRAAPASPEPILEASATEPSPQQGDDESAAPDSEGGERRRRRRPRR